MISVQSLQEAGRHGVEIQFQLVIQKLSVLRLRREQVQNRFFHIISIVITIIYIFIRIQESGGIRMTGVMQYSIMIIL